MCEPLEGAVEALFGEEGGPRLSLYDLMGYDVEPILASSNAFRGQYNLQKRQQRRQFACDLASKCVCVLLCVCVYIYIYIYIISHLCRGQIKAIQKIRTE